ncbi:MarR family winged helix-turn-helix transcriptional regulator [Butyricicoccus sp. Marseille-Q5471]|uniref:MarR family winged helix-turn-helix transcriptional regulator n=1 Tax=Butyricicoccus sp. Marseille-Q5471 TaxID=3039493 RepID=UPI0024BCEA49|nr:MarR family transcriptional regulator [Butyricicoccus sp. Marseille-Q5471]
MFHLEECLFLGAGKLEKLYHRYFCEEFADYRFTANEIAALVFLVRHERAKDTATDIAQECGISKALVTRGVSALCKRGFVSAVRDEHDRRVVHLHLTESGKAIAEKLDENRKYIAARLEQGIAPEDLACMAQVIETMQRNLDSLLEQDERTAAKP